MKSPLQVLAVLTFASSLAGCGQKHADSPNDGPAEEAGESVDEAAEETEEAAKDAADEVEDAAEDAKD